MYIMSYTYSAGNFSHLEHLKSPGAAICLVTHGV